MSIEALNLNKNAFQKLKMLWDQSDESDLIIKFMFLYVDGGGVGQRPSGLDVNYTINGFDYCHTFVLLPFNDEKQENSGMSLGIMFQIIGDVFLQGIEEDWVEALLYAEIYDEDNGLTYGRYATKRHRETNVCFKTNHRAFFVFNQLRECVKNDLGLKWIKAWCHILPKGIIACRFIYPDDTDKIVIHTLE